MQFREKNKPNEQPRRVTLSQLQPNPPEKQSLTELFEELSENELQPRRSPRLNTLPDFQRPNTPAFVSQEVVYKLIAIRYLDARRSTIPRKLMKSKLSVNPMIDLEEVTNRVVHPMTKDTITTYQKLSNDLLLAEIWKSAMCIKLGRLVQGFEETKGTNIIKFLTHNEICNIPDDLTVTYARIVVDYRLQKEDSNRVQLTVGGNLINYPGELTTRTEDLTTTKLTWNSVISTDNAYIWWQMSRISI